MIGLLGFAGLWLAGLWLGWSAFVIRLLLGLWWLVLVLATAPGLGAEGLGRVLGGAFQFWVLLGPLALLVVLYRRGLSSLRARAKIVPDASKDEVFSPAEAARYSRHLLLKELGGQGQKRLKEARVLVVGAGGLGSPALLYLAASGVGHLGVIDPDVVEASNLQRQILHSDDRLGMTKVRSAAIALKALNPFVTLVPHHQALDATSLGVIGDYELILDGTDNFDTRYLVNRTCVALGKPLISASLAQWEGQISLYDPQAGGPCYECLFPMRPAPGLVAPCSEAGVMAALPGVMGAMMAAEAIKHLTQAGQGLRGRLLIHDALYAETRVISVEKRPSCAVCGHLAA